MKLSVIVPVYNVEKYLAKCLDSLINQTMKDLEIIVVNDGSTDASQEIINDYCSKFSGRIKSFSKPNGGLSDARNYGLKYCTGEYIGFVDSDDFVTKEMFTEMYDLAKKYDAEIVICNIQKVDENAYVTQKITQIPGFPEKIVLEDNLSVFSDISYFACNKIFRKELFQGAEFKKGVHFEDIQLIPQLLLKCKTIAFTNKYHYQYFERADSITKTHTEKGLDMLKAVKDVENFYKNSQFKDRLEPLKNFQILEGVYSFLAYTAFVKDKNVLRNMEDQLALFCKERGISRKDIALYKRFGKNYLTGLPLKKKLYYMMYLSGIRLSYFR